MAAAAAAREVAVNEDLPPPCLPGRSQRALAQGPRHVTRERVHGCCWPRVALPAPVVGWNLRGDLQQPQAAWQGGEHAVASMGMRHRASQAPQQAPTGSRGTPPPAPAAAGALPAGAGPGLAACVPRCPERSFSPPIVLGTGRQERQRRCSQPAPPSTLRDSSILLREPPATTINPGRAWVTPPSCRSHLRPIGCLASHETQRREMKQAGTEGIGDTPGSPPSSPQAPRRSRAQQMRVLLAF